jgi:hypothetical protein
MILSTNDYDPHKTKQQILPYLFDFMPNGKLRITNTRNQVLFVTRAQVANMLAKQDLDAHRRRMYEAAQAEFEKAEKQGWTVQ